MNTYPSLKQVSDLQCNNGEMYLLLSTKYSLIIHIYLDVYKTYIRHSSLQVKQFIVGPDRPKTEFPSLQVTNLKCFPMIAESAKDKITLRAVCKYSQSHVEQHNTQKTYVLYYIIYIHSYSAQEGALVLSLQQPNIPSLSYLIVEQFNTHEH